jgi:F-type H+-transporting ATPase subunit epsilon
MWMSPAPKRSSTGLAAMVMATAELGEVDLLPGHGSFLTRPKSGQVRIKVSSEETRVFYISNGLLEVQPYLVTVRADYAENAANLDQAAAVRAHEAARCALVECLTNLECAETSAEALAQLRAIDHLRRQGRRSSKCMENEYR